MSLPVSLAGNLARTRFLQRATESTDGSIVYRLGSGAGYVRLSQEDWSDVGDFFAESVGASAKRAVLGLLLAPLALPIALAFAIPLRGFIPAAGIVCVGLALVGVPLFVYLRHSARVHQIALHIDRELGELPRVPAPMHVSNPVPFWLEFALMLFFAPHLFISMFGSLRPELFEGSSLEGVRFDWLSVVALVLLILRYTWPKLKPSGRP